ncbi:MAG: hypothetical protein ACPGVO_00425 [Spirulinaceae cyanobacterium]
MEITATSCHAPLSFAAYQEVQSHLQQLAGVEASLMTAAESHRPFCYTDSQVDGVIIKWGHPGETAVTTIVSQIQSILDFYQLQAMQQF